MASHSHDGLGQLISTGVTGKVNRLVTQMFFAGESLNETDRFLATALANKRRLIVALQPPSAGHEPDSRTVNFDIVLDEG